MKERSSWLKKKVASLADLERTYTHFEKYKLSALALERKKKRTEFAADEKKRMARISLQQKLSVLGMPESTIKNIMGRRDVVTAIPIETPQAGFVLERNVNLGGVS